jgi:glycerol uptake facilitator-like aquaporin
LAEDVTDRCGYLFYDRIETHTVGGFSLLVLAFRIDDQFLAYRIAPLGFGFMLWAVELFSVEYTGGSIK